MPSNIMDVKSPTTTISQEQYDFAKKRIARENLSDQIELLLNDYRDLSGHYDKLVSIEMIEAVGHHYYDTLFSSVRQLAETRRHDADSGDYDCRSRL